MNFLKLPAEIRHMIYEEALVSPTALKFRVSADLFTPPLTLRHKHRICPALLRSHKLCYAEANSLLYARNEFEFVDILWDHRFDNLNDVFVWFFNTIGRRNASLLRQICVDLSTLKGFQEAPNEDEICQVLGHLREHSPNITNIKILWDYRRDDISPCLVSGLTLMPRLKTVIIEIQTREGSCKPSDHLRHKICEYGWTLNVTTDHAWVYTMVRASRMLLLRRKDVELPEGESAETMLEKMYLTKSREKS